jgi:carbon-monoxide dehydrogenase large subunit
MSDPSTPAGGSILGAAVKRAEDPRFIRGEGRYLDDIHVEDEVWMMPVRSQVPHGMIESIDTDEAAAMPGVVGVFTADDVEGRMATDFADQPTVTRADLITGDRVRFVGDIVAVVLAETQLQAADAAGLVWANIEPLPPIVDPRAALDEDAPLLFPDHGSNVIAEWDVNADVPFDTAHVVLELSVANQRLAAVPLEANNALAVPTSDGGVDLRMGSQSVHAARNAISSAIGVDRDLVRVRTPDMGGGFGAKIYTYREHALCAKLAVMLGRPVRWSETRTENMISMTHGRAQSHEVRVAATRDGKVLGLDVSVIQNVGGYPLFGTFMPVFTRRMVSGPYDIPVIAYRAKSVVTNTTPVHAYRGAGRPEATIMLERVMDTLAAELGMDPVAVRRQNLRSPDGFPWTTATGERYDTGNYERALDLALTTIGYEALRKDQAERRGAGDRIQLGIGIGTYVEVTAPGGRTDWGKVEVHADGSATVWSGALSHGQGHETTFPQLVSRVLGIPPEQIAFVQADTDQMVRGGGTMGSRSLQMAGSAIHRSSEHVLDKARRLVAHLSEASVEDVVRFDDGRIGVRGVPDSGMTWSEIATAAADPGRLPDDMEPGMGADDVYVQEHASVPFGTHVAVAEVDTETGDVRLVRHVAVDDAGVIVNHLVLDGQIHGGIAQGVGQVLFEEFKYDEGANPLTSNLTGYLLPTASTLPSFELAHTSTPSTSNPLGVKGIGEAGTVGSTPAVYNAVLDAVAHLGVPALSMPLTPSKLWSALHEATGV